MRTILGFVGAAALALTSVQGARAATPLSSWSGAIPGAESRLNARAAAQDTAPAVAPAREVALSSWAGDIPAADRSSARGGLRVAEIGRPSVLSSWAGVIVATPEALGAGGGD